MRFFIPLHLTRYLREDDEADGQRRLRRLPVKIAILYRIPGRKPFHECRMTDVSRDGIGVTILDLSPADRKRVLKRGVLLAFRVRLPGRKNWTDFQAEVRWVRPEVQKEPFSYFIGLLYRKGTPFNDKLDILHMGLRQIHRRQLFRLTALLFCLLLGGVFLFALRSVGRERRTRAELVISEVQKAELKKEIFGLHAEAEKARRILERNEAAVRRQKGLLSERETALRLQTGAAQKLEKEINLRTEKMERLQAERELLEFHVHERTDFLDSLQKMIDEIGREWDISSESVRLLILDPRYEEIKAHLNQGRNREALLLIRQLRRRYPDSSLLSRLMFRALVQDGRMEEAEKVLQDYVKKQRETWRKRF